MEHILSAFTKWCLRKNLLASKNENLPIIFVKDTAHCSWLEFDLRVSKKHYLNEVISLTIPYNQVDNIKTTKERIKNLIKQYIKTKKQATAPKFRQINKACIDLIDNPDIYLDKQTNIIVKSIISKTQVVDYNNNTYNIENLYKGTQ